MSDIKRDALTTDGDEVLAVDATQTGETEEERRQRLYQAQVKIDAMRAVASRIK